jgi:hypothetical protein
MVGPENLKANTMNFGSGTKISFHNRLAGNSTLYYKVFNLRIITKVLIMKR